MKLDNWARWLIGLGSLLIIVTYFVPLWQIMLWAPQYPEGLGMKIWMSKLSGDVDIINGLNHYIGMKHIKVEMFPEFKYMGILVGALIAVGLMAAITGSRLILFFFTLMSYIYGIAALVDFYLWGYDYGHNLDPNAAIKVPGMSYQPPVIGYKNLLNFTSFSGPDIGAWIIILVCLLATAIWWMGFFKNRKAALSATKAAGVLLSITTLASCSSGPEPIHFGSDACHSCKMTLTDKRFGAELITDKGKVYKFDDLNCLANFMAESGIKPAPSMGLVAIDFRTGAFVELNKAYFLHTDQLKSPMRADAATFASEADCKQVQKELGAGKILNWSELVTKL